MCENLNQSYEVTFNQKKKTILWLYINWAYAENDGFKRYQ